MMHLHNSKVLLFLMTALSFLAGVSGLPVSRVKNNPDGKEFNEDEIKQVDSSKNEINVAQAPPHKDLKFKKEEIKDSNLIEEMSKNVKKISIDKLKPVDHMDGVRLEQDGHVNKEFHKEMFLGEAHEEFKVEAFDEAEDKLKDIVRGADTNKDGELSPDEMEAWILSNMKKHKEKAVEENEHIFKHLDPDGDNFVKWKEYYLHFLLSRGFEPGKVVQHLKDYDDSVSMEQEDKDLLVSYKFKWTDADKEPADNQLSRAEFMVFRHPEQSKASLQSMVENVMMGIDTNKDNLVSMEEFAALPPGEVEGEEYQEMDRKWQEDRRKEFQEILDLNHDHVVTVEEMKRYLDPMNPIQAKIETESLLSLMDTDKTRTLSMDEIMAHSELFITSKLANFAANVHDEF